MKKILLIYCFLSFVLLSCKSDDDNSVNPVDQLPPATQTGANKAGCLVNGEVFLPKGGGLGGNYNCYYQFVDGGYHFNMNFSDHTGAGTKGILIGTNNAIIEEGVTYSLNTITYGNGEGGRGGGYSHLNFSENIEKYYTTTPEVTGEMKITKLDFENNIVSGTFWFDAQELETGEIVEIREGRFDMRFTQ